MTYRCKTCKQPTAITYDDRCDSCNQKHQKAVAEGRRKMWSRPEYRVKHKAHPWRQNWPTNTCKVED